MRCLYTPNRRTLFGEGRRGVQPRLFCILCQGVSGCGIPALPHRDVNRRFRSSAPIMIEGGSPNQMVFNWKRGHGGFCPRVVGEDMGRGNCESITARARISRYTTVSKTNQHSAFVTYCRKEICMHRYISQKRNMHAHPQTEVRARCGGHRSRSSVQVLVRILCHVPSTDSCSHFCLVLQPHRVAVPFPPTFALPWRNNFVQIHDGTTLLKTKFAQVSSVQPITKLS